jgi:hypothetical protein
VRQVDSPRFSAAVTMDSLLENAKRAAKMIVSGGASRSLTKSRHFRIQEACPVVPW